MGGHAQGDGHGHGCTRETAIVLHLRIGTNDDLLECVLVFKQCFLIAETGFSHVESLVCFACLLCVSSCLGSETMHGFFFFLSQQQSPDTIPGPSAGPTVHKVEKHNTHGYTHTHTCFFSAHHH